MRRHAVAATVICASLLCAAPASAINFSFSGTFSADDDVQLFNFTADGTSTVFLVSYGYGGGTQADGNVVPAGGLDPIITLFDSSGSFIAQNDDGASACFSAASAIAGSGGNLDPVTDELFDTCFSQVIGAGDYTVALTQYNNFRSGTSLADGFDRSGDPNFTSDFGCTNGQFCDALGFNRSSAWAFDILNVSQASAPGGPPSVPAPPTLLLLFAGLAVAFRARRSVA